MSDVDRWTTAHDDTLRDALALMRREVESLPISDVRFVKARGDTRRHRTFAVGAAATAAVFLLVGFVGFKSIGSDRAVHQLPPANSSTTSNKPTAVTTVVLSPGPQVTAAEWQRTLGITKTVQIGDMWPGGDLRPCLRPPGTQLASSWASDRQNGLYGVQGTYRATSPDAGNAAAAKVVSQLVGCRSPGYTSENWRVEADAAWPKVFSRIEANYRSWLIVAHQGPLTAVLDFGQPSTASSYFRMAQVQALAQLAQQRLVQEIGDDPVTAVPVAAAGPQLTASEWQDALDIEVVQFSKSRPGEGVSTCLLPPGSQLAIGSATTKAPGFDAAQGTYRAPLPAAGDAAAAKAVTQLVACHDSGDRWVMEAHAAWPKVLSSTTADGKAWFIVAHQRELTSRIALSDPALGGSTTQAAHFTMAQIQALALAAQQRMVHEIERATARSSP